jgi:uncharacterized protein YndB with AHSA1/START domain
MTLGSSATLRADEPDFILSRHFDAPRDLVFMCWSEPSHLKRWWGPRTVTCPFCEMDFRAGGSFLWVMRGTDGTDYPIKGRFLEIVPGRRIVKEDDTTDHPEAWHDMVDPDRNGQGKRKIAMLTTVIFEDDGAGTRVTIVTRFPSIRLRDNFLQIGMSDGWNSSLDKLADLATALKDSDREINVTRLIPQPVDKVFAAFSDPLGLAVWWGPDGFTTSTHAMDFRVGGVWDYTMHGPDGTDYPNYVTYTSIIPGRQIAHDHGTDAAHPALFKAIITFSAADGGTRVHLRLILADPSERPGYVAFGAVEGGYQNLQRLDAYLAARAPALSN